MFSGSKTAFYKLSGITTYRNQVSGNTGNGIRINSPVSSFSCLPEFMTRALQ